MGEPWDVTSSLLGSSSTLGAGGGEGGKKMVPQHIANRFHGHVRSSNSSP